MAQILNLFRCIHCHYEMWVRLNTHYRCPGCQSDDGMMFVTSERRE